MAYNYDDQIPTWQNEGTEPADNVKTEGYKAGYKPPAAYFNWFWSRTLRWLNDLRSKLSSLHTQVTNVEKKVATLEQKDYDVSANDVLTKLKTVDGAESGLDADMLDGKHASDFAGVDHTHTQYATASHGHALATKTSNGFMSSEMFSKLEAFDPDNLNAYTHPSTHPATMITGLASVATSGNYADLKNKPTLSAVATSNDYNDLKNKPAAYTHPSTHPATMIEETENIKMFLAEERAKLAGIEALANNYTHPDSHPASMITGLSDFITSLGYGKSASGTYMGDGNGTASIQYGINNFTLHLDGSITGNYNASKLHWSVPPRKITLPFSPIAMLIFRKDSDAVTLISQNQGLTVSVSSTSTGANSLVEYVKLSGNKLYVAARYNSTEDKNLSKSFNLAGYAYNWFIF